MTAKASPTGRGLRRRWIPFPLRRRSVPNEPARIDVPDSHLPDGWFAFRRVTVGDGQTALVVAGVRGVFVIEALDAPGSSVVIRSGDLVVSGTTRPEIAEQALHHAALLQEYLGRPVASLIVLSGTAAGPGWIGTTRVLALHDLRSFLINTTGPRMAWDDFKGLRTKLAHLSG